MVRRKVEKTTNIQNCFASTVGASCAPNAPIMYDSVKAAVQNNVSDFTPESGAPWRISTGTVANHAM